MMGWLILLGLTALALLLLVWPGRLDRAALMLAGAALFTAAAGYAWQGTPAEPGAPAAGRVQKGMRADTPFAVERQSFLNKFGETGQWLGTADAMNRLGEDQIAVAFMRSAVQKHPRDADLWIGYANSLLILADGTITPAVNLAFDRAQAINPDYPAPRYFRGIAAIEAGDPGAAERQWRDLYASLPADSLWRKPLADRLAVFDALRAAFARQQAGAHRP